MASCTGAGGTGTQYTYSQLEGLWINAGGSSAVAPVAAAIALAESGGCSAALNLTDNNGTQTSVGLWQVSNGTHSYPAAWSTAAGNATEAVAKYSGAGNSLSPWGTYDSGAYKTYLNGSTTPDTNVPGSATLTSASSASNPDCLWGFSGVGSDVPVIGKTLSGDTSFCVLTRSQARALVGGSLMAASGAAALVGLIILAAAAFNRTGALQKTADAAAAVPGGGAVAEGLTVAHRRVTRSGGQVTGDRRGARETARRQQAREQRRLDRIAQTAPTSAEQDENR
jgi:hypothetical protein